MPNRILREGILTSESVNSLSDGAEIFYRRLMSVADDFGCYFGSPKLLRAAMYPLKLDSVSDADISYWIVECDRSGLIQLYQSEAKEFIFIVKFKQHGRATRRKFPEPPQRTCDAHASQPRADAPHVRTKAYSYSEAYSEAGAGNLPPSENKESLSLDNHESEPFSTTDVQAILKSYPVKRALASARSDVEYALVGLRRGDVEFTPLVRPSEWPPKNPVEWLRRRVEAFALSDEGRETRKQAHWWFQDKRFLEDDEVWKNKKTGPAIEEKEEWTSPPASAEFMEEWRKAEEERRNNPNAYDKIMMQREDDAKRKAREPKIKPLGPATGT